MSDISVLYLLVFDNSQVFKRTVDSPLKAGRKCEQIVFLGELGQPCR